MPGLSEVRVGGKLSNFISYLDRVTTYLEGPSSDVGVHFIL